MVFASRARECLGFNDILNDEIFEFFYPFIAVLDYYAQLYVAFPKFIPPNGFILN